MCGFWSKLVLVVSLLVVARPDALAADPVDGLTLSWTEQIHTYSRKQRLRTECRSAASVYACTEVVRKDFSCRCVRSEEGWRIYASLVVDVAIHTVNPRYLSHERMHILQLQDAIPKRFERFLEMRFRNQSSCETLAAHLSRPAFAAEFMNTIAAASNENLDSGRKPRRPAPQPPSEPAPGAVLTARAH